jgi:hypothetical protein
VDKRSPLVLVEEDPTRTAYGAYRTICACKDCTVSCRFIPGYLIPSDLELIKKQLVKSTKVGLTEQYEDLISWCLENLVASPGALVVRGGIPMRVPTLVPARDKETNWCKFLKPKGGTHGFDCTIHEVAPFGCAFFDSHAPEGKWQALSSQGLQSILIDREQGGLYSRVWQALAVLGRISPTPEQCRDAMQAHYVKELQQRVEKQETPPASS